MQGFCCVLAISWHCSPLRNIIPSTTGWKPLFWKWNKPRNNPQKPLLAVSLILGRVFLLVSLMGTYCIHYKVKSASISSSQLPIYQSYWHHSKKNNGFPWRQHSRQSHTFCVFVQKLDSELKPRTKFLQVGKRIHSLWILSCGYLTNHKIRSSFRTMCHMIWRIR